MDLGTLKQQSLLYLQASHQASLPGLKVLRREQPSEIEASVYEPVICLILHGRKVTSIGAQAADIGPGDALVISHHLPVQSRITMASPGEPYLAVIVKLDIGLIRSLCDQLGDMPFAKTMARSLAPCRADPAWLAPLGRYLDLLDKPLDARILGPAILRELHYRLLVSPAGGMLRHLIVAGSRADRVARAIRVLREDFRRTLAVSELARVAGMSVTAFHRHFKAVTGTTPLQYQKDLRLIAARTLLVEKGLSVSGAAYEVGYESPNHFSRDYQRKFGRPPSRAPNR